jgi:glycosyltransferase involved in cell wall biosynthesis
MKRLNVLWVIDHVCYDGSLHGGGRLFWNVLPRFDAEQFRVLPCLLRATEPIREVFDKSPVPVRILDKAKFDPTTLWTFLRLIKDEQIDVMHLHCYASSTFGRLAGWLKGIPTVIHDYDTEVYFPYPAYLRIADQWLAPMTQGAIAASPMVREFLIHKRHMTADRIRLMLHAVPMEIYTPVTPDQISRARAHLGVGAGARIVGTVTKLGPQRGNDILLRAAREVLISYPQAIFLLIYKPTYFHRLPNSKHVPISQADRDHDIAELDKLARELGIERQVRFVEGSDDVDHLMAACEFIVAPFLSERFSSVHLVEAMAMGKPLVTTNIGEQREFVHDGATGYLVAPGEVQALAERMIHLLMHPEEQNRMGRQARIQAEQYSVEAYAQTLQHLYADLAERKSLVRREGATV